MMRMLSLLFVLAAAFPPSLAPAADSPARADVARLFEAGWETSLAARSAVDREYQAIAAEGRAGPQAAFAYALVLIKQRRYDDALRQSETVLKIDPDYLAARQYEIRLLMLTKSYAKAMVSLGRLSETLAETPPEHLPAERREEVLRFLGRVVGFLEGPAAGDAAPPALRRLQRDVEKRLSEQELLVYDRARDGVLARFVAMTEETAEGREEALAEAERRREEARTSLTEQREEQQVRRTELLERREQLRQEVRDIEAALIQAERPLLDRLAVLERQAAIPRRELSLLLSDIDRLRLLAARAEDPVERDRLLLRAGQLEVIASRYDADLVTLERQAAAVNAERAALRERHRRETAILAGSMQSIDKELEGQQRAEKRLAVDEKRLDRPLTSGTRRIRAQEAEAAAFTTYEPLPLEEDRSRLLDTNSP